MIMSSMDLTQVYYLHSNKQTFCTLQFILDHETISALILIDLQHKQWWDEVKSYCCYELFTVSWTSDRINTMLSLKYLVIVFTDIYGTEFVNKYA